MFVSINRNCLFLKNFLSHFVAKNINFTRMCLPILLFYPTHLLILHGSYHFGVFCDSLIRNTTINNSDSDDRPDKTCYSPFCSWDCYDKKWRDALNDESLILHRDSTWLNLYGLMILLCESPAYHWCCGCLFLMNENYDPKNEIHRIHPGNNPLN